MKAKQARGVYNLNPTRQVFKLGSEQAREAQTQPRRVANQSQVPEAHESGADLANLGSTMKSKTAWGEGHISDFSGVESDTHHMSHPAMRTRASHPANHQHGDGRRHEEDHHAVRQAKGKQ
jgi:hypothetical protein